MAPPGTYVFTTLFATDFARPTTRPETGATEPSEHFVHRKHANLFIWRLHWDPETAPQTASRRQSGRSVLFPVEKNTRPHSTAVEEEQQLQQQQPKRSHHGQSYEIAIQSIKLLFQV